MIEADNLLQVLKVFANMRESEATNDFPGISGDFSDMFKNFGWLLGNNGTPAAPAAPESS